MTTTVLKRIERQYKPRTVRFVGGWRDITASELLAACVEHHVDLVFLVGGWDKAHTPSAQWFREAVTTGEWEIVAQLDDRVMAVTYRRGKTKISVKMSSIWFGQETDTKRMADAYHQLSHELKQQWDDEHAALLGTPAQTGMDLLQRSIPWDKQYPVLDDELRDVLYHNCPQGRIQLLTLPELTTIPGFFHIDARWMYAACVRELPGALRKDDAVNTYEGKYVPAFYQVEAQVPMFWQHIGLLPYRGPRDEVTRYPDQPGETFTTWIGTPEFELAMQNDWPMVIRRRLIFEKADPARQWIFRLRELREHSPNPLIQAAARHLVIDTIGSWHRQATLIKHLTPHKDAAKIRGAVPNKTLATKDGIEWYSQAELAPAQQAHMHPEWSGMVWSRARARLAKAALELPRAALIALRTDAISATFDPQWPDDGQPGAWRPKIAHAGELPAPQTHDDYMRLRTQLEQEGN